LSPIKADILVYASPIYQFTITALFKKFNERTMPVLFRSKKSPFPQPRNKIKKGKKGVVLLSTGAPFPFNVLFGMTKYAKKFFSYSAGHSDVRRISFFKQVELEMKK